MFWILYGLAVLLIWYENRFSVCDYLERPPWYTRTSQKILTIATLLVACVSVAGIWFLQGYITAGIAFFAWVAFCMFSFRYYYYRESRRLAAKFFEMSKSEKLQKGERVDESDLWLEALQLGQRCVRRNMMGDEW